MAQLDVFPFGDQEVVGLIPTRLATFFPRNIFCGHSFPSGDSRRAVCQFLEKDCTNTV